MRLLIILVCATVALAGKVLPRHYFISHPLSAKFADNALDLLENDGEIDLGDHDEDDYAEISPQFVLSWQVRRKIRKMQKQMPCGFPQYGIPPLAPFKMQELDVHAGKWILETITELYRFRIDGLDDFKINRLKLNAIKSKINFDFLFSNIKISATKYETDMILDALRQYGVSVEYEGNGSLEFHLQKLRITGVIRYKIPILWGSTRVTSLKTTVTLGKCESNIVGLMGDSSINRMINRQVENFVEMGIENNEQEISNSIEDYLVPKVNKFLKGNDIWTLIDKIFSSNDDESETEDSPIVSKCVPPIDTWN